MTNSNPITDRIVRHHADWIRRHYKLSEAETDDLRQEGQLAVLEALAASKKPTDITITTWLSPRVRGAMLDWIAKEGKRGMTAVGGKQLPELVELQEDTDEQEGLVDDASVTMDNTVLTDQMLSVLGLIPVGMRALIEEYYGLNGRKPLTLRELAAKRRCTLTVMVKRVRFAQYTLSKTLLAHGVRSGDV